MTARRPQSTVGGGRPLQMLKQLLHGSWSLHQLSDLHLAITADGVLLHPPVYHSHTGAIATSTALVTGQSYSLLKMFFPFILQSLCLSKTLTLQDSINK